MVGASVPAPLCLMLRGDAGKEKGLLPPPAEEAPFISVLIHGHWVGAPLLEACSICLG